MDGLVDVTRSLGRDLPACRMGSAPADLGGIENDRVGVDDRSMRRPVSRGGSMFGDRPVSGLPALSLPVPPLVGPPTVLPASTDPLVHVGNQRHARCNPSAIRGWGYPWLGLHPRGSIDGGLVRRLSHHRLTTVLWDTSGQEGLRREPYPKVDFQTWSGVGALLVSLATAFATFRGIRNKADAEDERELENKVDRLEKRIVTLEEAKEKLQEELTRCRGENIDLIRRLVARGN